MSAPNWQLRVTVLNWDKDGWKFYLAKDERIIAANHEGNTAWLYTMYPTYSEGEASS